MNPSRLWEIETKSPQLRISDDIYKRRNRFIAARFDDEMKLLNGRIYRGSTLAASVTVQRIRITIERPENDTFPASGDLSWRQKNLTRYYTLYKLSIETFIIHIYEAQKRQQNYFHFSRFSLNQNRWNILCPWRWLWSLSVVNEKYSPTDRIFYCRRVSIIFDIRSYLFWFFNYFYHIRGLNRTRGIPWSTRK